MKNQSAVFNWVSSGDGSPSVICVQLFFSRLQLASLSCAVLKLVNIGHLLSLYPLLFEKRTDYPSWALFLRQRKGTYAFVTKHCLFTQVLIFLKVIVADHIRALLAVQLGECLAKSHSCA